MARAGLAGGWQDGAVPTTPDSADPSRPANVVPIRPAPGRNWLAQWPITIVLVGVGIAMIMIGMDLFRRGCVVLSASVLLACFLRMFLPDADAGLLVVRSRRADVITLAVLGIGLTIFTFWVPAPS
jgi:hypothetical protein